MRLTVAREGDLYRLAIEDDGVRRPLLLPGERPSWAGGWAGEDGLGGYRQAEAVAVLVHFGLPKAQASCIILRAA